MGKTGEKTKQNKQKTRRKKTKEFRLISKQCNIILSFF